jgi:hypothetical protein
MEARMERFGLDHSVLTAFFLLVTEHATREKSIADWIAQGWHEVAARPDGPLAMRFYLQPLMATILAVRDGLKDARNGRPAYFWALFTHPDRRDLIHDGWRSVGKIFIIAIVLDIIYQIIVLRGIRPVETLLVATLLAIVPYTALRGPVNRIAKLFR